MIEATSRVAANSMSIRSAAVASGADARERFVVTVPARGSSMLRTVHLQQQLQRFGGTGCSTHHPEVHRQVLFDGPQVGGQPHRGVMQQDRDARSVCSGRPPRLASLPLTDAGLLCGDLSGHQVRQRTAV